MTRTKLVSLLVLLSIFQSSHAHPALGSWLRKVSAASSDGGWLWGWAWGTDSTVSVVDRSPPVNFLSRPASFGPIIEDAVMGYGIPMDAFTVPCPGDGDIHGHVGSEITGNGSDMGLELRGTTNLGCPKLCMADGHDVPEASESWIAIVQRGQCQFVEKVREAQRFGAKAVVVGGDDPDESGNPDTLVNMYSQGESSDVKIPATFIRFSDYARLSQMIATSNTSTSGIRTVSLQITSDYASWEWYSPILTFIVLLLLPSSLTLVTLLIHRVRAARAARRERAPEDVVNSLPWRIWSGKGWEKNEEQAELDAERSVSLTKSSSDTDLERGDPESERERLTSAAQNHPSTSHRETEMPPWFESQTECAICLAEFAKGDRVRVLPCKHIFHLEEVDEWLIHRKKLCPVCKSDVTQPTRPTPDAATAQPPSATEGEGSPPPRDLSPPRDSRRSSLSSATERTPLLEARPIYDDTQGGEPTADNITRE